MQGMARYGKIVAALYATAILVVLVLFARIEVPVQTGPLAKELFNFAHVPVFGVVAAALLGSCSAFFGSRLTRAQQYLVAWVLAATLGAVSEGLQIYGDRDSDPWDFARNLAGSSSALLLLATFDRALQARHLWGRITTRHIFAAMATALLVIAALPLLLRA
jgi:hypothetical protein